MIYLLYSCTLFIHVVYSLVYSFVSCCIAASEACIHLYIYIYMYFNTYILIYLYFIHVYINIYIYVYQGSKGQSTKEGWQTDKGTNAFSSHLPGSGHELIHPEAYLERLASAKQVSDVKKQIRGHVHRFYQQF